MMMWDLGTHLRYYHIFCLLNRNFRKQIQDELADSPSLRHYLQEIHGECYQDAREIVSDKSQLPLSHFPETLTVTLEQVLDENWFP